METLMKASEQLGFVAGQKAALDALLSGDVDGLYEAMQHWPKHKRDAFIMAERARIGRMVEDAKAKMHDLKRENEYLSGLINWLALEKHTLERPENSAWHRLLADKVAGEVDFSSADRKMYAERVFMHATPQIILIEHDWSSAFSTATDFDGGEWKPPFELTAFEFKISGRRAIVVVTASGEQCLFVGGGRWRYIGPPVNNIKSSLSDKRLGDLHSLLQGNVRAACIALDAQVAVTNCHRAPHKLNRAREKRGELPMMDHHTISLANRTRAPALPLADERTHKSPRMHFRRGHWRHYDDHKTWIRWNLVGNPDLGFIDKTYRL